MMKSTIKSFITLLLVIQALTASSTLRSQSVETGLEMLEGIDVLVYDIQDIGSRSYTYISTLGLAMFLNGEGLLKDGVKCNLEVIKMNGWKREMFAAEWINADSLAGSTQIMAWERSVFTM